MVTPSRTKAANRFATAHGHNAESAKRALCAAVFSDPTRVASTLSHELTGRFEVQPHRHTDLIQLDLIVGCGGEVIVGQRQITISGTTLMIAYPGQRHGYTLMPAHPPSEVWLVKLKTPRGWYESGDRPLPEVLTGLGPQETLHEAMARFCGDWTHQGRSAAALSNLATVIGHWPTSAADFAQPAPALAEPAGNSASARVRRAAETLSRRYHNPPSLDELAAAAKLSPRHFARRFQADFACTPHEYISARRLDVAKSMLLRAEMRVADVAEDLGFTSPAAFSRWFSRVAGQSPRAFRSDPETF